jgi:hypothetical protein
MIYPYGRWRYQYSCEGLDEFLVSRFAGSDIKILPVVCEPNLAQVKDP